MRNIVFVALLVVSAVALAGGRDINKLNGKIHAEAGQSYGDLETVNGAIEVDPGAVVKGIETVNGSVRIGDGARVESVEVVNGKVRIGKNVVVAEDVEAVNGKVSIGEGSTVGAEVETVNGGIELLGVRVGGNVETVNGDMFIGANTVVKGKLVVHEPKGSWFSSNSRKPKVVIEAGAVVEGGFDFRREVELVRDPAAKIGPQSTNVER